MVVKEWIFWFTLLAKNFADRRREKANSFFLCPCICHPPSTLVHQLPLTTTRPKGALAAVLFSFFVAHYLSNMGLD